MVLPKLILYTLYNRNMTKYIALKGYGEFLIRLSILYINKLAKNK